MNISLERWEHTCGDGCCYRTGYDVYINDEHIGFTEGEDAIDLVELLNEWFKNNKHERKKILIKMMRDAEELGLYDEPFNTKEK